MSSPAPLLRARGLVVRYDQVEAVRGVDLEVTAGAVVGLIGPDGAGKTSTLRVLAGLAPPSAGEVEAFGRPAWTHRRALHRCLGYLSQRFALYGDLTVEENVAFFTRLYGVPAGQRRGQELLERLGLAPFRRRVANHLSGGMKQKLALACALLHSPRVLLLDEPTTGVDPVTRRELWRLLGEQVTQGLTLLFATPYLEEAEQCTDVLFMAGGRLLARGSPAALKASLPGQVVAVEGGERRAAIAALVGRPEVAEVAVFGTAVHARVLEEGEGATRLVTAALLAAGLAGFSVRPLATSLEDVFLYYYSRSEGRPVEDGA